MTARLSLEGYAQRRLALTGAALKDQFPYCTPMEKLGVSPAHPGDATRTSFAHYDYLGLANDPRVVAAAVEAVHRDGVGAGASRLVGGERDCHRRLEQELSTFLKVEDTLTLVSGYGTNVATVSHLLSKDDLLIIDESVHNSIVVGAQLARSDCATFLHNNLDHLEQVLKTRRQAYKRVLVVVEGLYSMDGDIPNLPRLIEICRRYGAWTYVDEAHSIGVLGATGRGICEHFGLATDEVDLIVGTLSKAFAGSGGFVAGRKAVVDWMRYTLPGFVYSVGMPPSAVATARRALSLLIEEPERLSRLRANSAAFHAEAHERGLSMGTASGVAVIPVLFPDIPTTMTAANAALAAGYFVPPIVQIAVPKDAPRLRFFLTANHTLAQIKGALDAIAPFAAAKDEAPQGAPPRPYPAVA